MYNSSTKKLKAVLVAAMAIVLLVNAILPMTAAGSGRDTSTDYQYYVIKSGDTLTRIAKSYGVTVSDIMTANNLSNADKIISGKVIKIPLTEESSSSLVSTRLSLNLVEANVKDALSAIARNAGYTIIFVGDSTATLTVNLEQMSALKAIDYVTRLAGLSYLKDGNTLMVGTTAELNEKFVDKVVMTKFTLNYITVGVLQTQASALGLSNVQYVSTDTDDSTVYISAYPKELAKIQELIKLLDVSSNINAGAALVAANFKEISLNYITADEFSGLLTNLGLNAGITMASRPYSLYTFVTGDAYNEILKVKNVVDKPLSGKNAEANSTDNGSSGSDSSGSDSSTSGSGSSTSGSDTTTESKSMRKISLEYIDRTIAEDILSSFPYEVTVHGPSFIKKTIWIKGTASELDEAENAIKSFDTQEYADAANSGTTEEEEKVVTEKVELKYINRSTAKEVLNSFANSVTIHGPELVTDAVWLRGTSTAIEEAKSVLSSFDTQEYAALVEANEKAQTSTSDPILLEAVTLNYIDRQTAVNVLSTFTLEATVHGPENETKKLWLRGTQSAIDEAKAKIAMYDTETYASQVATENAATSDKTVKVTLEKITKDTAKSILSNLPYQVTVYDPDPSTNTLMIKGTGENVDKAVAELKQLDTKAVAEQVESETAAGVESITKVPLTYIDRDAAEKILQSFPLDVTICGPTDVKNTIWLNGTEKAKAEAIAYIKQFDTEDYASGNTTTETVDETVLEAVELEDIDRTTAIDVINSFPYDISIYGPDNMTKKIWIMGLQSEVKEIKEKLTEFDTEDYADSVKLSNQFFVYDLTNNTAQEILARLSNLDLEGVTFKTNSYAAISKTLIVYCDYTRQDEIKELLKDMDDATTSEVMYRAVEVTASDTVAQNRIAGLMAVHSEIPSIDKFKFITVDAKTGDGSACTTYVMATPEMADYIKGLLNELDSAA